jgi:hypothetical protein
MTEWQDGEMAEWRDGGMVEWQNGGMAEWYFTTYLIYPAIYLWYTPMMPTRMPTTPTTLTAFKSFRCTDWLLMTVVCVL